MPMDSGCNKEEESFVVMKGTQLIKVRKYLFIYQTDFFTAFQMNFPKGLTFKYIGTTMKCNIKIA